MKTQKQNQNIFFSVDSHKIHPKSAKPIRCSTDAWILIKLNKKCYLVCCCGCCCMAIRIDSWFDYEKEKRTISLVQWMNISISNSFFFSIQQQQPHKIYLLFRRTKKKMKFQIRIYVLWWSFLSCFHPLLHTPNHIARSNMHTVPRTMQHLRTNTTFEIENEK